MTRTPQTARSTRTRAALHRAAMARFQAQGVEATTAAQIAADAGVTLRTFYRHFTSKHDLLFADYDSGLQWLRGALAARPAAESVIESVRAAIFAFPYDVEAVSQLATFRAEELDPERLAGHLRRVEADLADAIAAHLRARTVATGDLEVLTTARCIAASVFGAMELWMTRPDRSLPTLARLCHDALDLLESGALFRHD
jgi:AcrR family transcriptional regulator